MKLRENERVGEEKGSKERERKTAYLWALSPIHPHICIMSLIIIQMNNTYVPRSFVVGKVMRFLSRYKKIVGKSCYPKGKNIYYEDDDQNLCNRKAHA